MTKSIKNAVQIISEKSKDLNIAIPQSTVKDMIKKKT